MKLRVFVFEGWDAYIVVAKDVDEAHELLRERIGELIELYPKIPLGKGDPNTPGRYWEVTKPQVVTQVLGGLG